MTCPALAAALALAALTPVGPHCALAHEPGRLVGVTVEIDGRPAPLLPSHDGSGRYYLEARRGGAYAIRLANRTGARLGVELRVDGLDVISGEAPPPGGRGRLYVLSPGSSTLVRGWRSSLDAVQRFEFVDEESSYAVRAHKSAARLGWIEARVFRERGAWGGVTGSRPPATPPPPERSGEAQDSAVPEARSEGRARSHPGTGWGERLGDRAIVVDFEAEPAAAESIVVRYEYADALRALGVSSPCGPWWRLWERERGEGGFAQPPRH